MKEVFRQTGRSLANLQWILRPSLLVLAFYQLSRIGFMLRNPATVEGMQPEDVPGFLFYALRFDLSLFFSLFGIFLLLLVLPFRQKNLRRFIRYAFTIVFTFGFLPELIDIFFFSFNGRRLDFPALKFLLNDALGQFPQLLSNFPLVPLLAIILPFLVWKSFPGRQPDAKTAIHLAWMHSILPALLVIACSAALIRNSTGQKPLLPGNAFVLHPQQTGHAALNSGFVMLKTLEAKELEEARFVSEESVRLLLAQDSIESGYPAFIGKNVVLLVLESFATEYTGLEKGGAAQTPFFDSLARAGTYFPNHFASGRTSRDALPAILASVPAWMDESFAGSSYVSTRIEGLGSTLMRNGYETAFFHGGKNGTMSFDLISRLCGFSGYYGLDEYPDKGDYDGNWGIFDRPFLQFSANRLNKMKQPFAACIFTLSSHQPYTLPPGWKDTTGTGGNPVFRAIRYSDDALRHFFSAASRMPWYQNTLFVLSADHTHQNFSPQFANHSGQFDVPLVFFFPGKKIVADSSRFIQHTDVRRIILEMLGSKPRLENHLSSELNAVSGLLPMQYQDGFYHIIHPDGTLSWDAKTAGSGWNWISAEGRGEPPGLKMQMMARLQYFRNGLRENKLFVAH